MNFIAPKASLSKVLKGCPFWVKLFIFSLVFPTQFSFDLGGLRISPYRLVLIFALVTAFTRLLSRGFKKVALLDWLIIFHVIWCFFVIIYHHDFGVAAESVGVRALEILGAYFLARAYIQDEKTFFATVVYLVLVCSILLPFAFIESITGFHLIQIIASKLTGTSFFSSIEPRLGLTRAYASFDHPILYGIFSASVFGLAFYLRTPRLGYPRKVSFKSYPSVLGAFFSLSSGALTALIIQIMLVVWDLRTSTIKNRWRKLSLLIAFVYIVVDLISNRSAMKVFLTYLTFSAATAFNRIIIFDNGIEDVKNNPLLGLGFNMWSKPEWMHSSSMDNFWLLQAVSFGLPGFVSLALPFILMLSRNWKYLPKRIIRLRTGWAISLIAMLVAACTVHFWNNLFVYFIFLLGMGAWFLNYKRVKTIND